MRIELLLLSNFCSFVTVSMILFLFFFMLYSFLLTTLLICKWMLHTIWIWLFLFPVIFNRGNKFFTQKKIPFFVVVLFHGKQTAPFRLTLCACQHFILFLLLKEFFFLLKTDFFFRLMYKCLDSQYFIVLFFSMHSHYPFSFQSLGRIGHDSFFLSLFLSRMFFVMNDKNKFRLHIEIEFFF